jgi:chorismate dehydratase
MFEIIPSTPARCAEQLANRDVEIGLIPSIEYQRIAGLRIIPGIAIAASGKVRSVLLVKRRGASGIQSVALDTSSRTSMTLIRVLLHRKMGIRPEFVHHDPDVEAMLRRCDAALIIGDSALQVRLDEYETVDLAESWIDWRQRPFVFAFWACRCDAALPSNLVDTFRAAKEWGIGKRREIAAAYGEALNLPESFLEYYLQHNIDHDLRARHIEGLEQFYRLARQENLIPGLRPLRFLD